MKYETVTLAELLYDPKNSRTHGEKNIDAIIASLKKFGQQKPIVVNEKGIVVAGNGTLEAARKLGWEQIEIVRTKLTETQATAYAIADNRTAELAGWDDEALVKQLEALKVESPEDFDASGWTGEELQRLVERDVIEDIPPDPPEIATTKRGDLWLLGDHRVLCGDSTNADDVARLMDGVKADMVLTDPPYGVSLASKNQYLNSVQKGRRNQTPIDGDHLSKKETKDLWFLAFQHMGLVMRSGACVYCFMPQGGDQMMMMMMMMMASGIEPRHEIIWKKNTHAYSRVDYSYIHEPILYAWKDGGHKFYGDFQTSVLEFPRMRCNDLHPTMKPIPILARLITNSSEARFIVLDLFLGSGSTLIACEQLDRKCYGMEISPNYCDVIVKRWETFTGKKATLA